MPACVSQIFFWIQFKYFLLNIHVMFEKRLSTNSFSSDSWEGMQIHTAKFHHCRSLNKDIRVIVVCGKVVRSASVAQTRSPDSQTCGRFVIPEVTGSAGGGDTSPVRLCVHVCMFYFCSCKHEVPHVAWTWALGRRKSPTTPLPAQNSQPAYTHKGAVAW